MYGSKPLSQLLACFRGAQCRFGVCMQKMLFKPGRHISASETNLLLCLAARQ